jgi:hypothetical protein
MLLKEFFFKVVGLYKTCGTNKTRGLSHCGLAIYMKKYLKAKEEL